ncbi:uncharacterized protein TNCV_1826301 [Trichonephila clavipes]|nr:uncharacterized protein TNCV_1826301 [Trichonephila clavipes]
MNKTVSRNSNAHFYYQLPPPLYLKSPGGEPANVAAVAKWYEYRTVACLVTSSSPVPLKTRRVGQRCTLNLSRAETSSRWCGVVVRRGGASSGVPSPAGSQRPAYTTQPAALNLMQFVEPSPGPPGGPSPPKTPSPASVAAAEA